MRQFGLVDVKYKIKRSQREILRELAHEFADASGRSPDVDAVVRGVIDFYMAYAAKRGTAGMPKMTVGGRVMWSERGVDMGAIQEMRAEGRTWREIAETIGAPLGTVLGGLRMRYLATQEEPKTGED